MADHSLIDQQITPSKRAIRYLGSDESGYWAYYRTRCDACDDSTGIVRVGLNGEVETVKRCARTPNGRKDKFEQRLALLLACAT